MTQFMVRMFFALTIVSLSACSTFSDEVTVTLGDGVRLLSINDGATIALKDGGVVAKSKKSGEGEKLLDLGGGDYAGFNCTLHQEGEATSVLGSLFSRPSKETTTSLTCVGLTEAQIAASGDTGASP